MNRSKLFALGVVGLGMCLLGFPRARADLFSPGPLAKPHAALEGVSNCVRCHEAGDKVTQSLCLDCHKELAPRVAKHTGFHGRLTEEKRACERCHKDHQGGEFEMVEWTPSKKGFNHKETGWPLNGKHAELKCEQCHEPRFIEARDINKWMASHPEKKATFLGLPQDCAGCHFDEHRGQMSGKCADCHGEKAFKPTAGFSHDRTQYPLTGKHKDVECKKCHETKPDTSTRADAFPAPVNKKSFVQYDNIEHESCLSCHEDFHKGAFGEKCDSCHSTVGWRIIHTPEMKRAFHDKTKYPLRGLHAEVDCKACHGPFVGKPPKFKGLAFEHCTDCHVDAHMGQLDPKGHAIACEGCHTVAGFLPAKYELAEHQKTSYPLEGAHVATPCSLCHVQKPALQSRILPAALTFLRNQHREPHFSYALFQIPGALDHCETCHKDEHAGQLKDRGGKDVTTCTRCHQLSSFHDVKFDHDKDSRFPLTGAHAKAQCAQCHEPTELNGATTVRYKPLELACAACHADAHAGQFHKLNSDEPQDCAECHETKDWKPAVKFAHKPPFTDYLLDGKHEQVKCEACHPAVQVDPTHQVRRYLGVPRTCEGCHQDFHHGEFRQFVPPT